MDRAMPRPPASKPNSGMRLACADAPVGIIGLGLMGMALSERLIDAGIAVIGFDIDPTRCDAFRDANRGVAASVREFAGQSRDHDRGL